MKISTHQRQTAWSTLSGASNRARAAVEATDAGITEIQQNQTWSDTYKAEQIAVLRNTLASTLQTLRTEATGARDLLLTAATELEAPAGDATTQLLAETRQARAWDRAQKLLASGRSPNELLAQAVEARDADTLAALRRELPTHVTVSSPRQPGLARLLDTDPDLSGLQRNLDVATARALGNDHAAGTAARLRLHATTVFPVAEAGLAAALTGRPRGTLQTAMAAKYAQTAAAQVLVDLGEASAPGSADAA